MKSYKNIILGVLMVTLSLSSMTNLLGQHGSIEFLETYSYCEFISNLDPGDRFFHLIDTEQSDPKSSKLGKCKAEKVSEVWKYIHNDDFLNQLPGDTRFAWGAQVEDHLALFVLKQPGKAYEGPDQSDLNDVAIQKDKLNGTFSLLISFSDEGAKDWEILTGKNVGRNIAILIEGKVYAAPTVREKIKHGKCMISGNFSESEVSRLKELLVIASN